MEILFWKKFHKLIYDYLVSYFFLNFYFLLFIYSRLRRKFLCIFYVYLIFLFYFMAENLFLSIFFI